MPTPLPGNKRAHAAFIYALVASIGIVWLRDAWAALQETEASVKRPREPANAPL